MTVTRFPNGISDNVKGSPLGEYPGLDPFALQTYVNEFNSFNPVEWEITETQAGATQEIRDESGGILRLQNTAADDDLVQVHLLKNVFLLAPGKQSWFKCRFKVNDATQSDVLIGMYEDDATPFNRFEGIYFVKTDGSTSVDMEVNSEGTATVTEGITDLVDDTYVELSWYFNGSDKVFAFVDGVLVASSSTENLSVEEISPGFALKNGEAVAKKLDIDYVLMANER